MDCPHGSGRAAVLFSDLVEQVRRRVRRAIEPARTPTCRSRDAGDEPQIAQSAEAAAHGALADVEVLAMRCGKASVDIEHGEHLVIQREARVLLGRRARAVCCTSGRSGRATGAALMAFAALSRRQRLSESMGKHTIVCRRVVRRWARACRLPCSSWVRETPLPQPSMMPSQRPTRLGLFATWRPRGAHGPGEGRSAHVVDGGGR